MPSAYEQRIQNYLASHPGATRAEARGHGRTPEHGTANKTGTFHFPGRTVVSAHSERPIERAINRAADNGNRVVIKVHTADGGWQQVGGPRGFSAGFVAGEQGAAGGIRNAITGLPGSGSGGSSDGLTDLDPDDIDDWQVDELEV